MLSSQWFEDFEKASRSRWDFGYRELGLQNVRYYAKQISRGKFHLKWIGHVITSGEFTVMPTHVEEIYRPIMFGKSEPWTLIVKDN